MVRAWYLADSAYDLRENENMERPGEYLSLEDLSSRTGCLYWKVARYSFPILGIRLVVGLITCKFHIFTCFLKGSLLRKWLFNKHLASISSFHC